MAIGFRRDMLENVHVVGKAHCGGLIRGVGGSYIVPRRPSLRPDGHELAFELAVKVRGPFCVIGMAYGEI